jgi:hypothetical protein
VAIEQFFKFDPPKLFSSKWKCKYCFFM